MILLMDNSDNIFIEGTLLNHIILDLRPIINEYIRTFPLFVIGKYDMQYPDYRIVNKNDGNNNKFMNTLANYYNQCNGLPSIDSFEGAILCGYGFAFIDHNIFFIKCITSDELQYNNNLSIKLHDIIRFNSGWNDSNVFNNILNISVGNFEGVLAFIRSEKIGLYARNDIIF